MGMMTFLALAHMVNANQVFAWAYRRQIGHYDIPDVTDRSLVNKGKKARVLKNQSSWAGNGNAFYIEKNNANLNSPCKTMHVRRHDKTPCNSAHSRGWMS